MATSDLQTRPSQTDDSWEDAAPEVLRSLRRAVAAVINQFPRTHKAVELAACLDMDRSLAWKLWRVAQGASDYPAPKHIPGQAGMSRFLQAAVSRGADPALIDSCREAYERFNELTRAHAGDRASADIMLAALTAEGRPRLELSLRRGAFRANSHFLGFQCQTLFQACVLMPPSGAFLPPVALVRGLYGLRRMRSDQGIIIGRSFLLQEAGVVSDYRRAPLDPSTASGMTPLVAEFSSRPLPGVHRHQRGEGIFDDALPPGPAGENCATDLVTAELVDNIPRDVVNEDAVTARVTIPCERFCFDVYSHRDTIGAGEFRLDSYSTIHGDIPYRSPHPGDRLATPETLLRLGGAELAPPPPDVPRYLDLMNWVFERLGHSAGEFELHRLHMRFPPIPMCAAVTYPLRF